VARPTKDTTANDRFWARIYYTDACWLWTGSTGPSNRYGMLRVNGRSVKVHRFAWELVNGPIPDGKVVRHRCDNTLCVNPYHLELGTQLDNVRDSISRGRFTRAPRVRGRWASGPVAGLATASPLASDAIGQETPPATASLGPEA
jgi:hypothetical protein